MSNFTNSSLINLTNLSPNRNAPRNQPISKITPHHFAGNSTIEGVSNFLANPARQASYNYGIGSDGRIVLIVEERNRCWGSSSGWNDHRAIVIGVANNTGAPSWGIADRAFESLVDLSVDIIQRNPGIKRSDGRPGLFYDGTQEASLTRHNIFSRQTCPGPTLQARFPELVRLVNARIDAHVEYPNGWPIEPDKVQALADLGVINSPGYWLNMRDIRFLNELIGNYLRPGIMEADVNLGITCLDVALDVLTEAGVMNSPNVWRENANNGPSRWLGALLINMANRVVVGRDIPQDDN